MKLPPQTKVQGGVKHTADSPFDLFPTRKEVWLRAYVAAIGVTSSLPPRVFANAALAEFDKAFPEAP